MKAGEIRASHTTIHRLCTDERPRWRRRNQVGKRPKARFASGLSQKMRRGIEAGAQHALVSPTQMRTKWKTHAQGRLGRKGAAA